MQYTDRQLIFMVNTRCELLTDHEDAVANAFAASFYNNGKPSTDNEEVQRAYERGIELASETGLLGMQLALLLRKLYDCSGQNEDCTPFRE